MSSMFSVLGGNHLLSEQGPGYDTISLNEKEPKNEEECSTTELAKLIFDLSQMLAREIKIRNQFHEERTLESEQSVYMDRMFMCEFIFSNL